MMQRTAFAWSLTISMLMKEMKERGLIPMTGSLPLLGEERLLQPSIEIQEALSVDQRPMQCIKTVHDAYHFTTSTVYDTGLFSF